MYSRATAEPVADRLGIYRGCVHYDNGLCQLCGCQLALKADIAEQACPIGRWGTITTP